MSRNVIIILLIGVTVSIVLWHFYQHDKTEITPFLLLPDECQNLDKECRENVHPHKLHSIKIKWYIVDSSNWLSRFIYTLIIHFLMGKVYPSRFKLGRFSTKSFLTLPFVFFTGYCYLAYVLYEGDVPTHSIIFCISVGSLFALYYKGGIWR